MAGKNAKLKKSLSSCSTWLELKGNGEWRTQKAMLVIMVVMMTIIIVFVPPQEGQGRVWGAGRRSRGQEEGWQYSQRCLPRILYLCFYCIWMLMMIMMMLTKMMRPANVLCRLGRSMPSWMASHSYTGALSYLCILIIGGYCGYENTEQDEH